jgi:ATP-dependent Clp protease adapter protein ClpS
MSHSALQPELLSPEVGTGRWMVTIFNNETTAAEDVVAILMRATGCDEEEAFIEMWEAHTFGRADVHFAGRDECERVADVIATVGVRTLVTSEWND